MVIFYLTALASAEDLMLLKEGDRRKVICAAVAKGRTAVGNDWLAGRLAMGQG